MNIVIIPKKYLHLLTIEGLTKAIEEMEEDNYLASNLVTVLTSTKINLQVIGMAMKMFIPYVCIQGTTMTVKSFDNNGETVVTETTLNKSYWAFTYSDLLAIAHEHLLTKDMDTNVGLAIINRVTDNSLLDDTL